MEYLLKQISSVRERFPGAGEGNKESGGGNDGRSQLQKAQTLKGERRGFSWLRRPFSSHVNRGFDAEIDCEFTTAVAAAAYAVSSLEETQIPENQKEKREVADTALIRSRSKKEDTAPAMEDPGRSPTRVTGETSIKIHESSEIPAAKLHPPLPPAPSLRRTPTEKPAALRAPSIKKTPSVPAAAGKAPPPPPPPPPPATRKTETKRQSSKRREIGEIEIDAWEKAEMAKIKEKYDKVNNTIVSWADKKKTKAKRRLERKESELDRRRAKALQQYSNDTKNIDYIAGGASAQAEERRRNEEIKVKEKAKQIRETGKFPPTCFCC